MSNDNPNSESLFKALKYRGNWPSNGFLSVEDSRDWVQHFVGWYHNEDKQSQINYMTHANRHKGLDAEILSARKAVLEEARQAHPALLGIVTPLVR